MEGPEKAPTPEERERELERREQELARRERRLSEREKGGIWTRVNISKRTLDRVILLLLAALVVVLAVGILRAM